MIDLRDVRDVRDDYVVLAAVTASFVLGGVAAGTDGTTSLVAAPLAIGVGVFVVWYFDSVARIPDVDRGEAALALRRAADELDQLDALVDEAVAEARDADEDGDDETIVVEHHTLSDLRDRSGLDDEAVTDGGESA